MTEQKPPPPPPPPAPTAQKDANAAGGCGGLITFIVAGLIWWGWTAHNERQMEELQQQQEVERNERERLRRMDWASGVHGGLGSIVQGATAHGPLMKSLEILTYRCTDEGMDQVFSHQGNQADWQRLGFTEIWCDADGRKIRRRIRRR